jgi:imidazole glycerol-phosphate synthase subunit HisF
MRIITKFDIRNNNIVKGINYEGVECIGNYIDIYNKICNYISNNINKNFEIILNDVTASLYNIKSGENNIKEILENKLYSLPHICSGGIKNLSDVDKYLSFGCDRITINTGLHDKIDIIEEIVKIYGAQILIPSIETRYINGDYYVYKSYGRDDTNIKLLDWIQKLKSYGIIEILIISMDKDGTLQGYDEQLLIYLKQSLILDDKLLSILYAGGIKDIDIECSEIEKKYSFITGVNISTLFYRNIEIIEEIPIKIEKFNVKKNLYFLSYLKGNIISVIKHFSKIRNIILVNSIKDIPKDSEICINGHYNTYELIIQLKNNGDFYILKKRLIENSIKYLGICAGLQLLLEKVYDEFSDKYIIGLDIIKNCNIIKLDSCHIGFFDNKFYCHSYGLLNNNNEYINEYTNDNIQAYQYHPENSL